MMQHTPNLHELFALTDRVALVTGAAMGIGREIAQGFLEMGAKVACSSRDAERASVAADELAQAIGGETLAVALDVRSQESVTAAFAQIAERWGKLDILVNNAGGAPNAENYHVWDRKLEDWKYVIDTNLTGTFLCTQAAARLMMPRKSGSIINIASVAGLLGRDRRMYEGIDMRPNLVDYAACKAGILGFTRDAAAELGPYGVRVNAISPGGVYRNHDPEFVRRYANATALRRMAREGFDLKGAAVLLASDAGAYFSGENIVVDGGLSIFR
jgi:NAD(P)-dependent dehydrogenase (short-subunit alcohol dehydrogenase family)